MQKLIIICLSTLLLIVWAFWYHMYDQYIMVKTEKDYLEMKYNIIKEQNEGYKILEELATDNNSEDSEQIIIEDTEQEESQEYIIQDTWPTAWEIQEQRREQEKIQKQQQEQLEIQQRNQKQQQDNILKCNQYYQKVAEYNQCIQEDEMEYQTKLLEYNNCILDWERYCSKPVHIKAYCSSPYKPSWC